MGDSFSPRLGPIPEFDDARDAPVKVVSGLAVGVICAAVGAVVFLPSAPALPFLLGLATVPFRRAKPFGVGAWAAACGTLSFLATLIVLFLL